MAGGPKVDAPGTGSRLPYIRVPFTKEYSYLPAIELIFKGTFISKTMYWTFREWFMEHGYTDTTGATDLYFVERIYVEKRFADREIRTRWRLMKDRHQSAYSDFTKWWVDIDFRMVGIHDEEMMIDGKKIKVLKGEVRMEIRGRLETDPSGAFSKHGLLRNFNAFFQKRIYKQELEAQRKELYRDLYKFYGMSKKFFDLNLNFAPEVEIFHRRHETA